MGERITVGLTTEQIYKHKLLAQHIEPYEKRKEILVQFIKTIKVITGITVIQLKDVYGSSLTDLSIDAICVTQATKK